MNIVRQSESNSPPPLDNKKGMPDKPTRRFWLAVARWFRVNTFAPAWLGERWGHPLWGILAALLLQGAAITLTLLLEKVFPAYVFQSVLSMLGVAVIALSWGAGPSVVATIIGALLIEFVVLPPSLNWILHTGSEVIGVALYLLAGSVISALASQTERARRNAQTLAASLEKERARLETVLEAMPDGVSLHDAQGNIVWLNRKGRLNIGSADEQPPMAHMPQVYAVRTSSGAPLTVEELPLARALKGETIESVELSYRGKGQEHPCTMSAAPLFDDQGRVENVVIVVHDISALRHAESEAAKRASELEAIFEAIADGVMVYDTEGRILRMNPAGQAMLARITPLDTATLTLPERLERAGGLRDERGAPLPQADWPQFRALRSEVLTGSNAPDILVRLLDGNEMELNVSGAPIRTQNGQVAGIVCLYSDVTERRRLERRTQEALESLLLMAEALAQVPPAFLPGEQNATPPPNEAAQRLVELTRRVLGCQRVGILAIEPETELERPIAAVGLNPEEELRLWTEQQKIPLSAARDPTPSSRLHAGEIVIVNRSEPPYQGKPNPYNTQTVLVAPIRIGERLIGILGLDYGSVPHSFTSEEIALAGAVSQLGALVLERERLMRERGEAQVKVLALQEATQRMDEFLSVISHELRTPVTSIKIGIQLLLKRIERPASDDQISPDRLQSLLQRQERGLQVTDQQIRRLTHLLDDLIDLSRIRTGKLEMHVEVCNLSALVREMVEEEQLAHPDRIIKLELPPDAPLQALADPNRIAQVLTNYLTNALKYSQSDQPVEVGLRIEGRQACVWVRDHGQGISPAEQARVWELFHRVPGIEVKSGSGIGLGLGLYISKMMIARHHGKVGVKSIPGQGSTFWFTLPLAPVPAQALGDAPTAVNQQP
ncbi:MAG TPA: ATP-binding protein [Ktedonobacterales bacterium]|jgi:PAS domain S-box-containing protein